MKVSMHSQLRPLKPCWILMVLENIVVGIDHDLTMFPGICLQFLLLVDLGHSGAEKALR